MSFSASHLPGRLPAPSHTRRAWVAHPRLGFIAPTATAGGDALPLHDTTTEQNIDWKFSPTSPPAHTLHPVDADTVIIGELEPNQLRPAERSTVPVRPTLVSLSESKDRTWIPWSLLVAAIGVGLVRLAVVVSDATGSPLATAVTTAVGACGLLLVIAQVMTGGRK